MPGNTFKWLDTGGHDGKPSKRRIERLRRLDYKLAAEVHIRFDVRTEAVEVWDAGLHTEYKREIQSV